MKFIHRLLSEQVVNVTHGKVSIVKGKCSSRMVREISLLCAELNIKHGEIWIDSMSRVTFSREIDQDYHQGFRNVLSMND